MLDMCVSKKLLAQTVCHMVVLYIDMVQMAYQMLLTASSLLNIDYPASQLESLHKLEVDNVLIELLCSDLWDQDKFLIHPEAFSTTTIKSAHSVGSSIHFSIFEISSFTADHNLAGILLAG